MRTIAVAAMTLLASTSIAHAQSLCRIYEYAELKDMPKELLAEKSCEYYRISVQMIDAAIVEMKSGRQAAAQRSQREIAICSQEMERMDRLLESQHGLKPPVCKPAPK